MKTLIFFLAFEFAVVLPQSRLLGNDQPRPQGLLVFQYGGGRRYAAAILENEKTLGTRLGNDMSGKSWN